MTAPQPPSAQPPEHEPHRDAPPQTSGASPAVGDPRLGVGEGLLGPRPGQEVLRGLAIAVALTVCGVALGVLWNRLAPTIPLISDGQAVYLKDAEGEQAIGTDGTFALLGLGFGLVSAAVVYALRRKAGVAVVVGLVVGGVLGSLVAWQLGMMMGPAQDVVAHAKQVGKGVTFAAPLRLQAKGVLLAWPLGAVLGQLALTGFFGPRDPEPAHWPAGETAGPDGGPGPDASDDSRDGAQDGSGTADDADRGQYADGGRDRAERPQESHESDGHSAGAPRDRAGRHGPERPGSR